MSDEQEKYLWGRGLQGVWACTARGLCRESSSITLHLSACFDFVFIFLSRSLIEGRMWTQICMLLQQVSHSLSLLTSVKIFGVRELELKFLSFFLMCTHVYLCLFMHNMCAGALRYQLDILCLKVKAPGPGMITSCWVIVQRGLIHNNNTTTKHHRLLLKLLVAPHSLMVRPYCLRKHFHVPDIEKSS